MPVADLLADARAAHAQYRRLSADSQNRNLLGMGAAIQTALRARLDAHTEDPEHTDPAWLADQQAMKGQTHDSLVTFYSKYLAPREASAA